MSYTDALARVAQINTEIAGLQTAFVPPSQSSTATTSSSSPSSATGASMSFNSALQTAMGTSGTTAATGTSGLPASASTMLTSDQQQFASELASKTGLDPSVVTAW